MLSIAYGIVHDMVTAHVWVEYFTIHHVKVVESESPVVMALVWGVIATWWMGAFAGTILWAFSTLGAMPELPLARLRQIMLRGMGGLLLSAMLVLMVAYLGLGFVGQGHDIEDLETKQRALAVAFTHTYSYSAGTLLVLAMGARALRLRLRLLKE